MYADFPNAWAAEAIQRIRQDVVTTPLRTLPLPAFPNIEVYLKDESAHPTGSLKHRLVRTMLSAAIASERLTAGTPLVAATGGAVAVAGAYFARLLDLPFTALVPASTPPHVRDRITREGGEWQVAELPPAALQQEARALAESTGGHFLDHFEDASAATSASELPTIADELFDQLSNKPHPHPTWVVTGAGTGTTSATIGHHLRAHDLHPPTRLAVVDPENSAYFPGWASDCLDYATGMPSRIPGIGRPRIEAGFRPDLIDLVIPVPDAASIAAMRWLHTAANVSAGPATGASLWGVCHLLNRMREAGEHGSIATLIGDGAAPYQHTHLNPTWLSQRGLDPAPHEATLTHFTNTAEWFTT